MARRVVWTQTAAQDLDETAEYIARDSPRYAATFVRQLRERAHSLATFAERGRMVPEFNDSSIRELIVRSYRLIYHVSPDTVSVLGIIHGARDLPRLWEQEDRMEPGNPAD